jgi:poly-beta-1,6-N-acetyl-D-glucosamine synthase
MRISWPEGRSNEEAGVPSTVRSRDARAGESIEGEGLRAGLTVIVPAYNEDASLADTVRSLQAQTSPPVEIIVVDDCSTDATAEVAAGLGVTVMRPETNTGTKAGAQNVALPHVTTRLTMAVDADTVLAPDAIETVLEALSDPDVAAACGFVLPQHVSTVWERGRYLEYLYAFGYSKVTQDLYGRPLISSGCFSVYRTDVLREMGGWSTRTMAEDMDLTWSLYEHGWSVRFIPAAVSFPIEPHTRDFMSKQLRRWSHGFLQNVRLHRRGILGQPLLRSIVAVGLWDALIASTAVLFLLPLLALLVDPRFLLVYVLDLPAVLLPALIVGWKRREVGKVIASYPAFLVLRTYNAVHMLRAMWFEFVRRQPLLAYEKGH